MIHSQRLSAGRIQWFDSEKLCTTLLLCLFSPSIQKSICFNSSHIGGKFLDYLELIFYEEAL